MSVDLLEVPTSELVDELKRRSEACIVTLTLIGEGGERIHNYYSDGDIIMQLGLVEAQKKRITESLLDCDLEDED